jgi:hypothetical protein
MAELTPQVWDKVAGQYRAAVTVGVIAKAFNLSRARIARRADRFGWIRDQANDSDLAPPGEASGSPQEARPAVVACVRDPRDVLMQRHRAAWADVYGPRDKAYRILWGEKPEILKGVVIDCPTVPIAIAKKGRGDW